MTDKKLALICKISEIADSLTLEYVTGMAATINEPTQTTSKNARLTLRWIRCFVSQSSKLTEYCWPKERLLRISGCESSTKGGL